METEQVQWAASLRELPGTFREALLAKDERVNRYRPAPGEWSAIEVAGHMVDKMFHWSQRAGRILHEEQPELPDYDQDAEVSKYNYQDAEQALLLESLRQQCEGFALLVETLPDSALQRVGVHSVRGPLTLRQCVELPLESVDEHLRQLHAAQEAASLS